MTMFELVARCYWCRDGRSFEAFNWEGMKGGVPSVRTRRRCGLSIAMFPLVRFLLDGNYSVMQKSAQAAYRSPMNPVLCFPRNQQEGRRMV